MLRFYWSLGKDISRMSDNAAYGTGFYKAINADLQDIFPDVHSFSVTNLKYMQYFYDLYPSADVIAAENRPQPEDDSPALTNRPQLGDDLRDAIFLIAWGHQKLLIDKCKNDRERAMFYVRKTLENNWSRDVLLNFLDTDLYERQGKALTNFRRLLPDPQSDLAQAMTKGPYNFDFLTLRGKYDEKELKDALLANTEKFLLELGAGFALMGREVRVEMGETENFMPPIPDPMLRDIVKLHVINKGIAGSCQRAERKKRREEKNSPRFCGSLSAGYFFSMYSQLSSS